MTGMEPFDFQIIRASAGSGKTYKLSRRFLHLLLSGVPCDSILATTFTRKAAAEIFARVLTTLAETVLSPDKCRALRGELLPNGDISEQAFSQILSSLLQRLVRNFSQIKIVTIDSFTTRLALGHPLELGLPLTWRIVEEVEQRRMLQQAVQNALTDSKRGDVKTLLSWFFQGETERSVAAQLESAALGLASVFRESISGAWHRLPHPKGLAPEEEAAAVSALTLLEVPRTKSLSPDSRFAKAKDALAASAAEQNWEDFLQRGIVKNAIAPAPRRYYKRDIPDDWVEVIEQLATHGKAEILNRLAFKTESTYTLLERIIEALEEIQNEEGGYRFDDIVRLTADYLLEHPNDRTLLDSPIKHLLLDEFQDTSLNQWQVFRPIAESIRDLPPFSGRPEEAGSFFCVGDVKQAIYAWRGGVAEIFQEVEENIEGIVSLPMNTNWRSTQTVLDAVNQVFMNLGNCPVFLAPPKDEVHDRRNRGAHREMQRWGQQFQEHKAVGREAAAPGMVTIETPVVPEDTGLPDSDEEEEKNEEAALSPAGKGDDSWQKPLPATFRYAIQRAIQIHITAPEKTIGILVRRNRYIGQVVDQITAQGFEVSQEGGVPLTSSPSVRTILSLLTLADHPGHTIAVYALAKNPAAAEFLGIDPALPPEQTAKQGGPALSRAIREAMAAEGLVPYLQRFTASLSISSRREKQFADAALKEAVRFTAAGGRRCDRLLELLEAGKIELASASKIRVMTIHASKGLEFDTVILPELDQPLIDVLPPYLVERPSPTEPIVTVQHILKQQLRFVLPEEFRACYDMTEQAELRDSLNMLYVAMTRAAQRLVMIVPNKESLGEGQTFADLIFSQLPAEHPGLGKMIPIAENLRGEILYQAGCLDSFAGV